jgi:flagellar assembly factor FliW
MKSNSRLFGEIEFDEKHVIRFSQGIIGFEELRDFLIIDDPDSDPFRWLVSLDDPTLSFPLIDSSAVVPEYALSANTDVTVFLVSVLSENAGECSVNLRSPIVIENATRTGKQLILEDENLPLYHGLFAQPQQ